MDLIVAVDEKWGIGKDNDLLYHVPEDMKFFRSKTVGKNVICGKKTLMSFPGGNPLPNRKHFVLTHGSLQEDENLVAVSGAEQLEELIRDLPEDEVLLIGGESVYRQFYKKCKHAFVTKIFSSEKEADVFFPNLDEDPDFELITPVEILTSKNGIRFSFLTYRNRNA